jgi:predicted component of type VI protein secretion system
METTLQQRLAHGETLINQRKWGTRSLRYVRQTVRLYGLEPDAWVQAFTLAALARDLSAAMFYLAGAREFDLTPEQRGAIYRELSMLLLKSKQLWMAEQALWMTRADHFGQGDPDLRQAYRLMRMRMAMAKRDWQTAENLIREVVREFEQRLDAGTNLQWYFNAKLRQMQLASRRHDWRTVWRIRAELKADVHAERYTWKHRLITLAFLVPGMWRLWP